MSSPCRTPKLALSLLVAVSACAACTRAGSPPVRAPASKPAMEAPPGPTPASGLYPGDKQPPTPSMVGAAYEGDPAQIAAGERYFKWYNCNGCHFNGGGGIGPPLMDDKWIYGGKIDQIFHSIADGRPNGMPTWRGKIPDAQIWELAAYVKHLSSPEYLQREAQVKTPLDPATPSDPHLEPRFVE